MKWSSHPVDMPAGTKLLALRGYSVVLPDMDFETYSEAGYRWDDEVQKWRPIPGAPNDKMGLGVVGAANYAQHPSTEVLSFYYNLKLGAGRTFWCPGMPLPLDLLNHLARGGLIEAHNSAFEWWIWNYVCVPRYGWPSLPMAQMRCSMAKARHNAYPGALGALSDVLRLTVRKDKDGDRLLKKFSVPRNPSKNDPRRRIELEDDPQDARKLIGYNETDIIAESEASAHLPEMEGEELEFWLLDQEINRRGVKVDELAIHGACAILDQCLAEADAELCALTGGHVAAASQLPKLKEWLFAQGVTVVSMDADAVAELLGRTDLPSAARRAIEIRSLAGSASVKKAYSIRCQMTKAGRLHDLFNYHGARSGRPTGEGPQPTNLPKAGPKVARCYCGRFHAPALHQCPWCGAPGHPAPKKLPWSWEAAADAIEVVQSGSLQGLRAVFGPDALLTISGCMRGFFVAAPGHALVCSDFSAIEGVVIAALAGEEWRLEVFRTHGKIYEAAASRMFGEPFENFAKYEAENNGQKHPLRDKGKRGELGLGFGGWINAWRNISDGDETDEEIKEYILAWRAASPAIVEFWGGQGRGLPWAADYKPELFGLEGMAIKALQNPGHVCSYRDTHYLYQPDEDVLYCYLISGRPMKYHRPRMANVEKFGRMQIQVSYEGWNTNIKNGPTGWIRMSIYGGKFAENVVQAVARDIQRYAMINLDKAGYKIVLHVYDEDVAEVPIGFGSVAEFERIMMTLPAWCRGWPIKAKGGWIGPRYRKD